MDLFGLLSLWPPFVAAGGPGGGGPVYADLAEALAALLASDPVLAPLYPGGWWQSQAPRDVDDSQPFGVYQLVESVPTLYLKPGYSTEAVTVHFWSTAPSADLAGALARAVRTRVLGTTAYTPAALLMADGVEANRYWAAGANLALDEDRSAFNADCFRVLTPVVFVVARGG